MNSVEHRERSRAARHEASHASACLFLGVVPDEIRIRSLAYDQSGYITGRCEWTGKRSTDILATAVGCADGHGVRGDGEGDLFDLEQLVPDADERKRVMDVALRVMEHRQFKAVRDALRTRLQFRDVLYRDEIARIAASVRPDATSFA